MTTWQFKVRRRARIHGGKTAPEVGPVVHSHPVEAVQTSGGDLSRRHPLFLTQVRRPWGSLGTCWGGRGYFPQLVWKQLWIPSWVNGWIGMCTGLLVKKVYITVIKAFIKYLKGVHVILESGYPTNYNHKNIRKRLHLEWDKEWVRRWKCIFPKYQKCTGLPGLHSYSPLVCAKFDASPKSQKWNRQEDHPPAAREIHFSWAIMFAIMCQGFLWFCENWNTLSCSCRDKSAHVNEIIAGPVHYYHTTVNTRVL